MPELNEDEFPNVPENVRSLIEIIGFLDTSGDPDIAEILEPAHLGLCMTCKAQLGADTVLFINARGVCAAYCGGPCAQDMAVLGWLQEQHDDIQDSVKFRGGQEADTAPSE